MSWITKSRILTMIIPTDLEMKLNYSLATRLVAVQAPERTF